jgi:hypothetical protein
MNGFLIRKQDDSKILTLPFHRSGRLTANSTILLYHVTSASSKQLERLQRLEQASFLRY